ncbi:hypothetical protein KI688_012056 [Linnemannia hyalina]|uniref:Uncharacterized protein n=1 Tax=Linnemannia hyalina TaxID=64524 RepID=A0A9P7XWN2_9FUNG|nr:hypothetical protein KI688_012056 [Linnemannia hyalina]
MLVHNLRGPSHGLVWVVARPAEEALAASTWKNVLFLDLALDKRIEYMIYWSDPNRREEGFRKADAILLELFDGISLEEEMRVAFTDHDEYRWRTFNGNKRNKKERIAWNKYEWRYFLRVCKGIDLCSGLSMAKIGQPGNIDRLSSDGQYRLGACIYIPQGLNFAKELLDDFKTSKLFQGTDLENCRKGIKMLRDLMIETAEKMKLRLPKLLEEHAALIAGVEDSDHKDVQVVEEAVKNIYDQYETGRDDALECYNSQGMVNNIDNTVEYGEDAPEYGEDAPESGYFTSPEIDLWESEEEAASSFWMFDSIDDDDSFFELDHDLATPMQSFGALKDARQSDDKTFQKFIDGRSAEFHSSSSFHDHDISVSLEKRDDGILRPKNFHARSLGSTVQSHIRTPTFEYSKSSRSNTTLVEHVQKKAKSQLDTTKAPQKKMATKLKTVKKVQWTTHKSSVLSNIPSVSTPLQQPLIGDFMFKGGKENRPPRLL